MQYLCLHDGGAAGFACRVSVVDEADKANKLMACDWHEIDLQFASDSAE